MPDADNQIHLIILSTSIKADVLAVSLSAPFRCVQTQYQRDTTSAQILEKQLLLLIILGTVIWLFPRNLKSIILQ